MYAALQSCSLGSLPRGVIWFFSFFYLLCFYNKIYSLLFHCIMPLIQLTLSLMTVNVRCCGFPTSNVSYSPLGSRHVDTAKLQIYKPQVYLDIRKYFFSIRVIEWNSLSVELINCNTVESFKKRIDCYFRNRDKLALSVFPHVASSHLRVASWVELSMLSFLIRVHFTSMLHKQRIWLFFFCGLGITYLLNNWSVSDWGQV